MKLNARTLAFTSLTLSLAATGGDPLALAQGTPVLVQDLRELRVPEKVSAVLWTRREESFTLQVSRQ